MDYFKNLLGLLKIEREVDKQTYQKLIENTSVSARRADGLAWYPIAIRGTEMGRGDYLSVEVERTTHHDLSHSLRFGMPAVLFSNHDPKTDRVEGTITYQGGNRLKISLRTDELPDWSRHGKLGVELLFDDNSYDEMIAALKLAGQQQEKQELAKLVRVLTGEESPTFNSLETNYTFKGLNQFQEKAALKILAANELAIVHGPPGTGKTTTLIQAIKALVKTTHRRVLVVAPSNAAVDLLSEKLMDEGLEVLRVGNPARVSQRLTMLTLDSKVADHPRNKEIRKLKKQANEYKSLAHKYKRSFGKSEREQRMALFDEAHRIIKDVSAIEQYITDDLIAKTQVITATLVGANHYTVRNLQYETVVIDEAGQALEPACWIPILKAKKVVLAGDHFQLPPTIKSPEAAKGGLETTMLEKNVALHSEAVVLLQEQYRMNELIMGYSSKVFYQNKLTAFESVRNHKLFESDLPLMYIDTAGCGFEEKLEGTSSTNPEEATFVVQQLTSLVQKLTDLPETTPDNFPSIGVIAPYKQQIQRIAELVKDNAHLIPYQNFISVNTVDSFQGQERDIIFISLTRSNSDGIIGFLADIRRMNVAMTRARKKLVVIGDSSTLGTNSFYADFVTYAEKHNAYFSAWEFMEA